MSKLGSACRPPPSSTRPGRSDDTGPSVSRDVISAGCHTHIFAGHPLGAGRGPRRPWLIADSRRALLTAETFWLPGALGPGSPKSPPATPLLTGSAGGHAPPPR